ncbi:MAG: diguanylate cyclase [Eubacterium sp.]|nr:diguanylate cyclase [Eubacterium sp.]
MVNDNEGHQAGDDLIRCAAKMICDVFAHSPVFRIGGDEFVVFLSGDDFNAREELVGRLRVGVFQHMVQKNGPVVAVGVAAYKQERDRRMSDVFERADKRMYMDKQELKKQSL